MTTRAEIVREAREWLGTRWLHGQSAKGAGCDCIGLVRGVAQNLGIINNWLDLPGIEEFTHYGRLPTGQLMIGCEKYLTKITRAEALPGDLIVTEVKGLPYHMAILGDYPHGGLSIIHAWASRRKVVETRLDESWESKVVAWFRFPGVQS